MADQPSISGQIGANKDVPQSSSQANNDGLSASSSGSVEPAGEEMSASSDPALASSASTKSQSQKLSKNPKYRGSKGKHLVIKCRACDKELKYQNYESHLKSQHPSLNS